MLHCRSLYNEELPGIRLFYLLPFFISNRNGMATHTRIGLSFCLPGVNLHFQAASSADSLKPTLPHGLAIFTFAAFPFSSTKMWMKTTHSKPAFSAIGGYFGTEKWVNCGISSAHQNSSGGGASSGGGGGAISITASSSVVSISTSSGRSSLSVSIGTAGRAGGGGCFICRVLGMS